MRPKGQKTPTVSTTLERMLKRFTTGAHRLLLRAPVWIALGAMEARLIEGAHRSNMDAVAAATPAGRESAGALRRRLKGAESKGPGHKPVPSERSLGGSGADRRRGISLQIGDSDAGFR